MNRLSIDSARIAGALSKMLKRTWPPLALMFLLLAPQGKIWSQPRAAVIVTVRNARGDTVSNATIHATTAKVDTTLLLNSRGEAVFRLPAGPAHLQVRSIGYEPVELDIQVGVTELRMEISLTSTAQQLEEREVRATWIGVRGTIGDNKTKKPLSGATITSSHNKLKAVTDATGHFEIPFENAETVVLQVAHSGYETRIRGVDLKEGATDIVFLLEPGNDKKYMKFALLELQRRSSIGNVFSTFATRSELEANGGTNLYDALESSGILQKKHLRIGSTVCLFVDGLARPFFPVSSVDVKNVDFIEVYGQGGEATGTLGAEWPRNVPCMKDEAHIDLPKVKNPSYVWAISVWMRK